MHRLISTVSLALGVMALSTHAVLGQVESVPKSPSDSALDGWPKPPELLGGADTTSMSDLTFVSQEPGSPHPEYPRELENGRISGHVLIRFVVDPTGRAELPSVLLLKSSHPLFALAVRAVLPKMKFIPATLHGRKVSQVVQMPFDFAVP